MKLIPKIVVVLTLVSFFTDVSSAALYPVLPVYLKQIGFSVFLIGMLQGASELAAGLAKGYFGHWSDRTGRRLPFVRVGYLLSAVAKPMLAVSTAVGWVFFARLLDRLGKSVRTSPRDALLAQASDAQNRHRVFNFHRAGDTLGTVVGATAALAFLHFFPGRYAALFLWTFIP
ncbi:MAG: MFS transporter, partial [Bacteroidia bacterium]|nr:MFS transporter [Bacteroidia bacterium]MDW8333774.1 MFS transporter [Bacteroidia bacterium]